MRILSRVSGSLAQISLHLADLAHPITAVRSIKEVARTWGDTDERHLAAAVRFVDDFEGWVHS
jgi:hypothetical protein